MKVESKKDDSRNPRWQLFLEHQRKKLKRFCSLGLGVVAVSILIFFTVLLVWAFESRKMPALQPWHTLSLVQEFSADKAAPQSTLGDYLNQEKQLFNELEERLYSQSEETKKLEFCRYLSGGPQDPQRWKRNWNRTFELVPENIQGGALLLHGLTDSPYSMRRIGELLQARGFYVLGLRLPGHGTIPAALTKVHWQDWLAASKIGADHVRKRIGSKLPFVIAGYSNGAALAIKYSLDTLSNPNLTSPDRLLLFSPEIGIMPLAEIANIHKLLSFIPYFAKFKWQSIEPEFDPFKYNSFPMNAAMQAFELTETIQSQITRLQASGKFADFPPTITFLSWIDATVKTSATINRFYSQIENQGSELIVFDLNRQNQLSVFLPEVEYALLDHLAVRSDLPYRLTIITNINPDSKVVSAKTKAPFSSTTTFAALGMEWPDGVFSLSHVAIPFSPDDPLYGANNNAGSTYQGLPFGQLQPRGETHLLTMPLGKFMRLRHNPFFAYLEKRVAEEIEKTLEQ